MEKKEREKHWPRCRPQGARWIGFRGIKCSPLWKEDIIHPMDLSFARAVRCQSFVASRDVAGKKQLRELRPRERCDLSDWMTTYHAVGPLLSKGAPSSQVVGLFHSYKPGRFLNRNLKLV